MVNKYYFYSSKGFQKQIIPVASVYDLAGELFG